MIPILDAIESGAWLTAEYESDDNPIRFRLRLTGFSRIDLAAIDGCENLKFGVSRNVWRLGLDVVNLWKREVPHYVVERHLVIVDQDGFEFKILEDNHLRLNSDYAETSGLRTFFPIDFPPKIKRSGAYPFELPDEFDVLFLAVRHGDLREA